MLEVEQSEPNPIETAREEFNEALLSDEYQASVLLTATLQLQNVLIGRGGNLGPERIFHELALAANQAARRARNNNDTPNEGIFSQMRDGFNITYEAFTSKFVNDRPEASQHTPTEGLTMSYAKGELAPRRTATRVSAQKSAAQTPEQPSQTDQQTSSEGTQPPPAPQKRRGKSPKTPNQ